MHQYAHYPVDGNTFRERLRNVSFTRRRWQNCPAMPCPGCGCRIIPSIPATILQDVCLMLGFFLFPLSFLLLRMRAHVSPVWAVLCALLWWLIQFTLPTLFAISIPWKLQGESQSADRFHKIVSHPIMAMGPGRSPAAIPARDGMKISLRCRSLSHRQRRGCFYSGFRIKYPPGSFPLRSALRRRRTGSHPLHSLPDRWRETDRRWRPPAARRCGRAGWAR